MRTAEQVAAEMASEWRRRFGHKMSEIERIWLARCIMEARHELAVDMMRADGPRAREATPYDQGITPWTR